MPTIDHEPRKRTAGRRFGPVVQLACIALTALLLFGLREGAHVLDDVFGPGFVWGNIFGAGFVILLYLVICWFDPSSRPRGSRSDQ